MCEHSHKIEHEHRHKQAFKQHTAKLVNEPSGCRAIYAYLFNEVNGICRFEILREWGAANTFKSSVKSWGQIVRWPATV